MYALACVVLAISGVVLMAIAGVGPFAREPWESYYFALQKKPKWLRSSLLTLASISALICTLILVGLFND